MTTLTIREQNQSRAGHRQPIGPREAEKVKEGNEAAPTREMLTSVSFVVPMDGLLFKFARYLSSLCGKLFGTPAAEPEPVDKADSYQPTFWSCCM